MEGNFWESHKKIKKIGEGKGQYGKVYVVKENGGDDTLLVAKKTPIGYGGIPPTTLREISLLKTLNHENIVRYLF
jgi:serine/threonine protein kinase